MKFKPFQGPAQFVFKDPDSGTVFKEDSKKLLIDRIRAYRFQNGYEEIEFLGDVLENYWCSLPENVGRCQNRLLERGLLPSLKAGLVLIKNYVYGSYVSAKESARRASICIQCPHNILSEDKGLIAWQDSIAYHSLKDHKTPFDKKLGTCEVCSCPLKAKVHLGGNLGLKEEVRKKLPDYCWQK